MLYHGKGKIEVIHHPGAAPHPFFFPAYRAKKKQALAKINKAARQGIKDGLK